ncbi:MAG: hypothetical protein A2289_20490 [Deltaproteobacteria bacterium RIFOXYA12_FULL_58_15]|nr:MAG: hypothetical protein A2289_20490 [Deltaproteobacteria bacterium RIFOXYA12_FULL_58_15]
MRSSETRQPEIALTERFQAILKSTFERAPFVSSVVVKRELADAGADLSVRVNLPRRRKVHVFVQVKRSGQPRVVREAINQVLRYRARWPNAYAMIAAPYISPRSGEICATEGVGHVDLAGNCRLCFGEVYIEVGGHPNPFAERRDLRTLYSPRASRVLRVLMLDPKRLWKVQELAKSAEVSIGLASRVKACLADREWLRLDANGLGVAEPRQLLQEWAGSYSFRKNVVTDYFSLQSVPEIEAKLAEVCSQRQWEYALTGFSGAARLVSAVRYNRVQAFVGAGLNELPGLLELKPVTSGANVSLLAPFDAGVFAGARTIDGIRVVSPVQLYLDLKSFHGRGEEAARALLEQVMEPSW